MWNELARFKKQLFYTEGQMLKVGKRGAPLGNQNRKLKNPDDRRKIRTFKASDHEWELILGIAKYMGTTASEYIRRKTMED